MDVGVDRERRHAKRLGHHHTCGLVADAGERLEKIPVGNDLARSVKNLMGHRRRFLALVGARPTSLMNPRISSGGSAAVSSGVLAAANNAGVTSLTFLSVVWAESATATRRVYGSV